MFLGHMCVSGALLGLLLQCGATIALGSVSTIVVGGGARSVGVLRGLGLSGSSYSFRLNTCWLRKGPGAGAGGSSSRCSSVREGCLNGPSGGCLLELVLSIHRSLHILVRYHMFTKKNRERGR